MTDNLGTHAGMIFQHNIRRLSLSFQQRERKIEGGILPGQNTHTGHSLY